MSSDKREFKNPFEEYNDQSLVSATDGREEVANFWKEKLVSEINRLLKRLQDGLKYCDENDFSVATGWTGIALLYLHLADTVFAKDPALRDQYFTRAVDIIQAPLRHLKGRRVTFLYGDAGPLAIGAVLHSRLGDKSRSDEYVHRLVGMYKNICTDRSLPDEVLYGRAGYLFALLYIQKNLGEDKVPFRVIDNVCEAILLSGQTLAHHEHSRSPLMYKWHEKHYVGAAHGFAGILFMLLQCRRCSVVQSQLGVVQGCVDYLLSLQLPSGNFPSSLETGTDRLVQWCHGAPGLVLLLVKSYQVFEDRKYLQAAERCSDVVWTRGILRKGYGMCHGVSGNAYAFLSMYKQTRDQKYLYRAIKFAEWCFSYGEHGCRTPDRPMSLFEGLAGTLYFMADLIYPKESLFPSFDLGK